MRVMGAKGNLAIDVVATLVYVVASFPAITGVGMHEWLGLVCVAVFVVHTCVHADWLWKAPHVAEDARADHVRARRLNFGLDIITGIVTCVAVVSGLGISGTVLQAFGWYVNGYYVWGPVHAVSVKVLLALIVVHVAAHGRWIASWVSRKGKVESDVEQYG